MSGPRCWRRIVTVPKGASRLPICASSPSDRRPSMPRRPSPGARDLNARAEPAEVALLTTISILSSSIDRISSSIAGQRAPSSTRTRRSAVVARARARLHSFSFDRPKLSRSPAVSAITTGSPARSIVTSMISLVVPGAASTIAASRPASAFNKLDLPALGGPISTTAIPSRMRSPRLPSLRCRSISPCIVATSPRTAAARPAGKSSSEKSISASRRAIAAINRRLQPLYSRPSSPSSCRNACRCCAAVSAAIRSASASAWVRSSLPCRNARRVELSGFRRPQPREAAQRRQYRRAHRPSAVHVQLRDVFAGKTRRCGEPETERLIQRHAVSISQSYARCTPRQPHLASA